MDVVKIIRAPDRLNHPALRGDHIEGEQKGFWDFSKASHGARGKRVVAKEGNIRLQNKSIKATRITITDIDFICDLWKLLGIGNIQTEYF